MAKHSKGAVLRVEVALGEMKAVAAQWETGRQIMAKVRGLSKLRQPTFG